MTTSSDPRSEPAKDDAPDPPKDDAPDWTVNLDASPRSGPPRVDALDWTVNLDARPNGAAEAPVALRRWVAAGLLIAMAAASFVIWGPQQETGKPRPAAATVLGSHLAVPIALHLPADAVTTADGSYLGVQFPAGGVVLVTVPTQVVDPSGNRAPLPDDPAAWLARHPDLFISQVRQVRVGGFRATQLDYRRSRMTAGTVRSDRLPLFCGWRAETEGVDPGSVPQLPGACTRITADARVRATFIHVGDRTVLVEAVWRAPGGAAESGRIPRALQRSYTALLAGLTPAAASKAT